MSGQPIKTPLILSQSATNLFYRKLRVTGTGIVGNPVRTTGVLRDTEWMTEAQDICPRQSAIDSPATAWPDQAIVAKDSVTKLLHTVED